MKNKLPIPMLRKITSLIENGQPAWGMLLANEYLEVDSPLRVAISQKAKSQIELGVRDQDEEVTLAALNGSNKDQISATFIAKPKVVTKIKEVPFINGVRIYERSKTKLSRIKALHAR